MAHHFHSISLHLHVCGAHSVAHAALLKSSFIFTFAGNGFALPTSMCQPYRRAVCGIFAAWHCDGFEVAADGVGGRGHPRLVPSELSFQRLSSAVGSETEPNTQTVDTNESTIC